MSFALGGGGGGGTGGGFGGLTSEERGGRSKAWTGFRNAFQAMSDWGDEFERAHFEGDFLGAVAKGPKKTISHLSDWGDNVERTYFKGDFVGAVTGIPSAGEPAADLGNAPATDPDANAAATSVARGSSEQPSASNSSSSSSSFCAGSGVGGVSSTVAGAGHPAGGFVRKSIWKNRSARTAPAPPPEPAADASPENLWEESQRLQAELTRERDMRKGRVQAKRVMDEAIKRLQTELAQERASTAEVQVERREAEERCDAAERRLADLLDAQHSLQGRKMAHDADIRRERCLASAAAAAAARHVREMEEEGARAWAKPGPETEALAIAKLEFAEVQGLLDEARLAARTELKALHSDLEAQQDANTLLLRGADYYVAPNSSIVSSVHRLLTVASGHDDPCAGLEARVSRAARA